MKKIIGIVFCFQLCVIIFYSVFFFRFETAQRMWNDDTIWVDVNFANDRENFDRFIEILYETGELVTLGVRLSMLDNVYHYYTTDVTLNGEIILASGRFPEPGTAEFIHSNETGSEHQVGVIDDILPGTVLSISHFSNPFNFTMDGHYQFQTTDLQIVEAFVEEVSPYVFGISIFYSEWLFEASIWLLLMVVLGSGIWELAGLSIIFLATMLLLISQYAIQIGRKYTIFKLHGFSTRKVLQNVTLSVFTPLIFGSVVAYLMSVIYIYFMRFHLFLADITVYFIIISVLLILFYLLVLNSVAYSNLHFINQVGAVRGRKSHQFSQLFNHILKAIFSIVLLLSFFTTLENIEFLLIRHNSRHLWGKTEDIYRINFGVTGYWSTETDVAVTARVREIYDYLMTNHGGFIMDGNRMAHILETDFFPYVNPETAPPLKLSPSGYRITITESFLELNPIQAVNGIEISEQLIWDAYSQNLLVPESLQPYEAEFSALYLELFYFEKVQNYNSYAFLLDQPLLETTIDELSLNIIYVNDNQCYFTFNIFVKESTGGLLCDPIAVVFHPDQAQNSFLMGMFQNNFYFRSNEDTQGAFESILPAIKHYDLISNITFISPVYHEFIRILQVSTSGLLRFSVVMVLLILSTTSITYFLVATYFESNKYELTVKRHFGYSAIKRNKNFVLVLLSYTVPIIIMAGYLTSWTIFLIGLIIITLDLVVALAFERHLMNQSFAKIMKGDR